MNEKCEERSTGVNDDLQDKDDNKKGEERSTEKYDYPKETDDTGIKDEKGMLFLMIMSMRLQLRTKRLETVTMSLLMKRMKLRKVRIIEKRFWVTRRKFRSDIAFKSVNEEIGNDKEEVLRVIEMEESIEESAEDSCSKDRLEDDFNADDHNTLWDNENESPESIDDISLSKSMETEMIVEQLFGVHKENY